MIELPERKSENHGDENCEGHSLSHEITELESTENK